MRDYEINTPAPQLASEVKHPWKVAVPPHKQRFYILMVSHLLN